jgi:hypothetical protein
MAAMQVATPFSIPLHCTRQNSTKFHCADLIFAPAALMRKKCFETTAFYKADPPWVHVLSELESPKDRASARLIGARNLWLRACKPPSHRCLLLYMQMSATPMLPNTHTNTLDKKEEA